MKSWFFGLAVWAFGVLPVAFPIEGSQAAPGTPGGTLEKVKTEGRVIVGIGQEAAPFGYKNNGELVGYDVDIARAVVRHLEKYVGRTVILEFTPVTDETRIS